MTDTSARPAITAAQIDSATAWLDNVVAACHEPETSFAAMQEICDAVFGARMFSVLLWNAERGAILRIYNSHPAEYPAGVWKPMGPTPWGARVLKRMKPIHCRNAAELRWAFPDAELLISLDCVSNLAAPVIDQGKVLGVVSISEVADHYREEDLQIFHDLAQRLVPILRTEIGARSDQFAAT